jgi:hypothetical protein
MSFSVTELPFSSIPPVKAPVRRRGRPAIPQLILRELSFSGELTQIARAIQYNPAGAETALTRMEAAGQVLRDEAGRWAIAHEGGAKMDVHLTPRSEGRAGPGVTLTFR